MCGVKGRRFIVLFKLGPTFNPLVYENVCMIISSPTKHISAISHWIIFITVLPTRWRRKAAGIEITSLSPYVSTCKGSLQFIRQGAPHCLTLSSRLVINTGIKLRTVGVVRCLRLRSLDSAAGETSRRTRSQQASTSRGTARRPMSVELLFEKNRTWKCFQIAIMVNDLEGQTRLGP